jgi:hypothetical protein
MKREDSYEKDTKIASNCAAYLSAQILALQLVVSFCVPLGYQDNRILMVKCVGLSIQSYKN